MIVGEPLVKVKRLALKIGSGKTPEGGADAYVPEGVAFIRSQNVHFDGLRLDDVVFIDPDTDAMMSSTRVRPNDLLLNITGASIGRVALAPTTLGSANVNQHVCIIRPSSSVVPRFLLWCLQSSPIQERIVELQVGGNRDGLNFEQVGEFAIPHPARSQQRAVADYLDREAGRIDALIAAKERMVALLTERVRAMVAERLLGPPVTGAGPGAEQVAARPGWTTIPFRWLFREIDERSATGQETLLSVSQTRGVIPQSELGDRRQYAETLVGYKLCRPGDLVVNRMWVYYGALGTSRDLGLVSPDYAVFRPVGDVSSEFAAYVLRTPAYVAEMTRLVRGIGAAFQGAVRKPRLHPNELGLVGMPVPPALDQSRILEQLGSDMDKRDTQMSLLERSVALLRVRRQAVITAAVTGQIDVPVAA